MLFKGYKKCVFCKGQNLIKKKNQKTKNNFYTDAIKNDFKISKNMLEKIKVYQCKSCGNYQHSPWFSENFSKRIYSNIYGQHNRSWLNLLNFFQKGKLPNHGNLFGIVKKNIKFKNYAEFNSPFMGLMINFFEMEYKKSLSFYNNILNNTVSYLSSRQLAGKKFSSIKKDSYTAQKKLNNCKKLKKKYLAKRIVNKYLFVDESNLCWGQNDNYKSVNSRSLASELFEMEIINLNERKKSIKFDLFGIFHTLDHTFEPNKVLNFALDNSKLVIVYCHVDEKLEKQHLFSFSRNFLKYLNKKKIYTFDLTNFIDKNFKTPEMYFLCSKNKKIIKKIKI